MRISTLKKIATAPVEVVAGFPKWTIRIDPFDGSYRQPARQESSDPHLLSFRFVLVSSDDDLLQFQLLRENRFRLLLVFGVAVGIEADGLIGLVVGPEDCGLAVQLQDRRCRLSCRC